MIVVIIELNRFSNSQQDSGFHFLKAQMSISIIYMRKMPQNRSEHTMVGNGTTLVSKRFWG